MSNLQTKNQNDYTRESFFGRELSLDVFSETG